MSFDNFCRAHGLIVDHIIPGRWVRTPTVDHPRSKNGAYKFLGNIGWVQNHARDVEVSTWRTDERVTDARTREIVEQASAFERKTREGWKRAADKAQALLSSSRRDEHNYLHIKGLGDMRGLVLDDDSLMVPMRHWRTNALVGAQLIKWDQEEFKYEKKMLLGMRAKGAVLRLGSAQAARVWLVEGYATGLSVEAAIRLLKFQDAVLICFSAGNLIHVAKQLGGAAVVFADNDASQAGEKAAIATGLPYCMSPVVGEDANDMQKRVGIFKVAQLCMSLSFRKIAA